MVGENQIIEDASELVENIKDILPQIDKLLTKRRAYKLLKRKEKNAFRLAKADKEKELLLEVGESKEMKEGYIKLQERKTKSLTINRAAFIIGTIVSPTTIFALLRGFVGV